MPDPIPADAVTVDAKTLCEIANALHDDWCGCDSWDGVNCETYHDGEFPESAEAVKPVVAAVLKRQADEIARRRAALNSQPDSQS